jgi:hypothetical protein
MLRIKVAMKKKFLRRKRKIGRETREGTKGNSLRKFSTQRKTTLHQKRMMIVIMIHKEYSSWKYNMMKNIRNILTKKVKSISEKN